MPYVVKRKIIEKKKENYYLIPKVAPSLFHKSASSGLTRKAALEVNDKKYQLSHVT